MKLKILLAAGAFAMRHTQQQVSFDPAEVVPALSCSRNALHPAAHVGEYEANRVTLPRINV